MRQRLGWFGAAIGTLGAALLNACSDRAEARGAPITAPPAAAVQTTADGSGEPAARAMGLEAGGPSAQQLSLPFSTTVSLSGTPFFMKNTHATGGLAYFEAAASATPTVSIRTVASNTGASALQVQNTGSTSNLVASFNNFGSGKGVAISARDSVALQVTSGVSGRAASFWSCGTCTREVVFVDNHGTGPGILAQSDKSTSTADLRSTLTTSTQPALKVSNAGTDWAATFTSTGATGKGVLVTTAGGAGLQVVGGSKNAVVGTSSGARALYTEESSEVWFTDYGFGRLAGPRMRVPLDPVFVETIARGEAYHVFVQAYGASELYVANRTPQGFDVVLREGDPRTEFSYRIVAKRRGFEGKRLERAPWADSTTRSGRSF